MNKRTLFKLIGLPLLLLSGGEVLANADTIQSLQDAFRVQTATWFAPLQDIATWTLLTLATISWAWSAIQMVLRNADLQEFVTELVRLIMFTGFFLALIFNADTWSSALIQGFMWAGNQAAGTSAGMNLYLQPAGILERGFILSGQIIEASGRVTYLAFAILALAALIIYALIAAYALLVMAEMYIVTAAGVLLLGFGGSQWTADYAKKYLSYCVSVGAKLYVMFLVVGLGEQFIYSWAIGQDKGQFVVVLSILGILIMLLVLVKMIPDMIQGIISGASIGNNTPTIRGMAAAAGGAVAGAVVGGAGATMAVREASKLAGQQLASQSASSAAPSSGSVGGISPITSGAAQSGSTSGSSQSPLPMPVSSSQGRPGAMAHMGQTAKNLVQAAGNTAAGRVMGNYNSSHGSFSGSMAQHMRAQRLAMPNTNGGAQVSGSGSCVEQNSVLTGTIAAASSPTESSGGSTNTTPDGQAASAGWVGQVGGFDALSIEDQQKAAVAHEEWQSSNPESNTFDVGSYVSYVQQKHQEREANGSYVSPAKQADEVL